MQSPLLFPVKLKNDKIIVLDETRLPSEEVYIEVSNLEEALLVLESMKTRSLGQVLLFFYSCALFGDIFSIDEIVRRFREKRPTFDFPLLGEILKKQERFGLSSKQAVDNFVSEFDRLRRARACKLAEILPNSANILTICNVNGELLYLYEELQRIEKKGFFYVSETRPYLQGARLTFWELRKNNIPCKLICDNQAAVLMREKRINCVITGADRATTRGDIINKIGTYSLARLARYFNISFYSLTQYPRDLDIDSVKIEERDAREVFMFLEDIDFDIDAIYPSFDITKSEFVTECIELEVGGAGCRKGSVKIR
jgi:methylthioribose-1-phosphate isomerase